MATAKFYGKKKKKKSVARVYLVYQEQVKLLSIKEISMSISDLRH